METLAQAMQRVKATTTLKAFCEGNLRSAPRGNSPFACPACDSGASGERDSNTAFTITGNKWHCHACGKGGDVFDLAGILNKTEDRAEQCNAVAEWAGVDGWRKGEGYGWDEPVAVADEPEGRGKAIAWDGEGHATAPEPTRMERQSGGDEYAEGRAKHREYIQTARQSIGMAEAVAYLSSRGIDLDTARAWGLGYDPNAGGAKDANGHWCRRGRIVIPYPPAEGEQPYYHADRSIDPNAKSQKYSKPKADEVGPEPRWNPAALKAPAFFVVEGQMDALAVAACGYPAIALGNRVDRNLVPEIEATEGAGVAVLMLDNDERGHEGREKLAAQFTEKGLPFLTADVGEIGTKDAGEAWTTDRDRLTSWLGNAYERARQERERAEEEARRRRMERYHIVDPTEAVRELYDLKDGREPIPSGLATLDNLTGGGLHAKSLHIVGAQSSEGKTTITLQVADHVARGGHPVLFVTIEQRASELISKSLARIARARDARSTLTARAITNPMEREAWGAAEWEALADACNEYADRIAPNIMFMDPDEPPSVRMVWEWAEVMREERGEAPVVFVDYLQILAADKGHERDTEKQVTDRNITLLRRMAGGLNTPVWVVASLNRMSYTAPISTDAFKESGGIEYGADLLMGLEPFDLETRWHNATDKKKAITAKALHDKTRRATRRWMDLKIMKNRFGALPEFPLAFVYDASADTFEVMRKVNREKRAEEDTGSWDEPLELEGGLVM